MPRKGPGSSTNRRAALPALLAIPALIVGAVALIGPRNIWEKTVGGDAGELDFTSAELGQLLGDKPNVGLAAPDGFFGPDIAPRVNHTVPEFDITADDLFAAVKEAALALPNTTLVDQNFAAGTLRFVRHSSTMGFPDTVNIQLVDRPGGMSFVAAARARVGYSDLGMNARLLGDLINGVSQTVPQKAAET